MDRATAAAAEVARINTFFPLLPQLGLRWAAKRPWEGMTVAVNAHLTTLTAALVRELALGGGTWVVCAANEATTDPGVVELLRQQGIQVETGRDGNFPVRPEGRDGNFPSRPGVRNWTFPFRPC